MLRSLFAGIGGLRAHQQMLDVTGNNIANVNMFGFKSSNTVFEDTLGQLLKAAAAPQNGNGGTNSTQVGLGVRLAAVTTNFGQGAAQTTGRSTDLMINGDGFFVVRDGAEQKYTRAGAFTFDANGKLTSPNGSVVQGWIAVNGVVDTNGTPGDVSLPIGTLLQPKPTTQVVIGGNLPGDTTTVTPFVSAMTCFDQQGNPLTITTRFTKITPTSWGVTVSNGTTTSGSTTISFAGTGSTPSPTSVVFNGITVDLSALTSFAGQATVSALSQNGSQMGSLQSFTIGADGLLTGVFSQGLKQPLAQLTLATFNNPVGLEQAGSSMYRVSANSGTPQLGKPGGGGGRGLITGGALEMSNVDLAAEFTGLIIAQRGFQANSKLITTSDELLQDLVNLKR